MSEAFWRTRFNADPTLVGRDIRLDGSPYTVVGVVPKDFQLLLIGSELRLTSMLFLGVVGRRLHRK